MGQSFLRVLQDACLPIVDVPVHTVMGMPMTEGMGMPVAFITGTKKSYGLHHGQCPLGMPMGIVTGMSMIILEACP